jgi:hypothetical protein
MGSFCHCCNLPRFNFRCDPPDSLSGSAPSASKLWQQLDFALNRKSIVVDCCDLDQESRVFSACCAHSVESRIFISIPDSLPSLIPCHGIFHHLRVDDGLEAAVAFRARQRWRTCRLFRYSVHSGAISSLSQWAQFVPKRKRRLDRHLRHFLCD